MSTIWLLVITKTGFRNFLWIPCQFVSESELSTQKYSNTCVSVRFGQLIKYTLFRSPFNPHLVPISLKMRSPFGPHFEKFRSTFHVGAVRPLWALQNWSTWTAPASTIFTKNPPSDLLWSNHSWAGWRTSMPVFPHFSSHIFHFWVLIFLSFEFSYFFQEFASNLCAVWGQSKPNPQPLQIKIEKEKWLQQKCCNLQLLNDMKTTRNYV